MCLACAYKHRFLIGDCLPTHLHTDLLGVTSKLQNHFSYYSSIFHQTFNHYSINICLGHFSNHWHKFQYTLHPNSSQTLPPSDRSQKFLQRLIYHSLKLLDHAFFHSSFLQNILILHKKQSEKYFLQQVESN